MTTFFRCKTNFSPELDRTPTLAVQRHDMRGVRTGLSIVLDSQQWLTLTTHIMNPHRRILLIVIGVLFEGAACGALYGVALCPDSVARGRDAAQSTSMRSY